MEERLLALQQIAINWFSYLIDNEMTHKKSNHIYLNIDRSFISNKSVINISLLCITFRKLFHYIIIKGNII